MARGLQLDWVLVRVNTIRRIVFATLLVLVAAVVVVLAYRHLNPSPLQRAQRAIEQAEVIRLSLADQECFAQALLSPPPPAPALERAFARRSKLLRTE